MAARVSSSWVGDVIAAANQQQLYGGRRLNKDVSVNSIVEKWQFPPT